MTFPQILIFLAAVFTGSTIQAVSGFGFGIFVMTIFPYILPSATCATLSAMLSLTSSITLSIRLRRLCNYRRILPPLLTYFVFSFVAVSLSASSPDKLLKRCLAVVLILLGIYFIWFSRRLRIKPTVGIGLAAGALSGVLGGFFSMGGPPIVLYLVNASEDNDHYIADIQTYFAITGLYTTTVRAANGLLTATVLTWWAIGVAAMLLGVVTGRALFHRLDPLMLKRIVYLYMAVSGVLMLF
ncbi:MAG: sulfite exporter TauE/SafE family protein [Clostridia bacterium]|nr:sulfite exporter TauE/SafE family protein [Clostridia bacterium]